MIRHISVFFLKEEEKEANMAETERLLKELGKELTGVLSYYVGAHAGPKPPAGAPGAPEFGDLIQIIDFADASSAASYPAHPGHRRLVEATGLMVERVVAMDVDMRGGDGTDGN